MEREPDNAHDSNAIRVENSSVECVGYLPRGVASLLAMMIDAGKIRVEGEVPSVPAEMRDTDFEGHRCPVIVSLFLREEGWDDFPNLEEEMDDDAYRDEWLPHDLN